jgi:hypothetical protein
MDDNINKIKEEKKLEHKEAMRVVGNNWAYLNKE